MNIETITVKELLALLATFNKENYRDNHLILFEDGKAELSDAQASWFDNIEELVTFLAGYGAEKE
jgi:hypothetical protein